MTAQERESLTDLLYSTAPDPKRVCVIADLGQGVLRSWWFEGTIEHLPEGDIIWFDDVL